MKKLIHTLSLAGGLVFVALRPASAVTIPTVPVGNAGNAGEVQSQGTFGAVAYNYRIGTTEVTNAQYVEFLNAVAATDTYGLYSTTMGVESRGGITRSGSSGTFTYSIKANVGAYTYAAKPVVYVSLYDTLRFANWLHNGQPTGSQGASTTEDGAYTFSGATTVGARNAGADWFLPSENEWYKAAYYDGDSNTYYDYPTSTDATPDNNVPMLDSGNSANFYDNSYTTGSTAYPMTDAGAYASSASPYGTFDQGGNVWEWTETLTINSFVGVNRGGAWRDDSSILLASYRGGGFVSGEDLALGFRVATVPEPSTFALACLALAVTLAATRCIRQRPR